MVPGGGDGRAVQTGVKPGALTDLLRQVASAPEPRESEPAHLLPGSVIGRFEVQRELGGGGFGAVYEARDRELGRQVALKMVRAGRTSIEDGEVVREAEAIARLSHPNLITLYDVGRSERGPYLVFELLRGMTLQERIEDGPLPVQEAVHIAVEVARGLAHAHAEGVVHRDLKPSNVFVTKRGQVKILDFGLAHAFGCRRISGGTPAYMAPEQWEDDPEDERTDVFALGVMLYQLLSGELPFFEGEGRWSAGPATAPRLDVPAAPGLADLVSRMLDRMPRARPRDGASALAALTPIEDALRQRPADASPPARATRRKATIGDLVAEFKRRRVFRVMAGYGLFAFAVLQVSEPIIHGAHLPDWVPAVVLAALAAGFPVAVALAWLFDLTSRGVERTPAVTRSGGTWFSRGRLAMLLVGAAVLAALPAAGWYAWRRVPEGRSPGTQAGTTPSIAVLPFADLSPNHDQEYFADGVAEEIRNALAHLEGLRVVGRSSAFYFKGRPDDLRAIGQRLGVANLLEGSLRKDGDRIRITAQLIRVADGTHLWAEGYDRQLSGVFKVQEEIARAVVSALQVRLMAGEDAGVAAIQTAVPEAYQAYLLGRRLLANFSEESDRRAVESFERAIRLDPGYAPAWGGLSAGLYSRSEGGVTLEDELADKRRALEAANRAVALAPGVADGYVARAKLVDVRGWDWTGAIADAARAVQLSPRDAVARTTHGMLLAEVGRDGEGLLELEHATQLDPLSAEAWAQFAWFAVGDQQRKAFDRAREIAPSNYYSSIPGGSMSREQALAIITKKPGRNANGSAIFIEANLVLGHQAEARAALDELIACCAHNGAWQIAKAYDDLGDRDRAFEWLERARVQLDSGIRYLRHAQAYRGDPRTAEILRKMNLPVE